MPINEQQLNQFNKWMAVKGPVGGIRCPACGKGKFSTGEIVAAPIISGGGISIGGPSVPELQVVCDNCGFILHFAAARIGLIG